MSTPTSDEQALTEQIAEAMCPRHNHLYFWQYETLTYCGECLARASAVLPVVKAMQRDAVREALDGLARDFDSIGDDPAAYDVRNWRDTHHPKGDHPVIDYYDRDLQPMDDYSNHKTKWGGRRVLQTNAGGYRVSTVWSSLDHSYSDDGPIVFETLIWDGEGEEVAGTRHRSEEEAARWHLRALDAIRAGKTPDYSDDHWMETTPVTTPDPRPKPATDALVDDIIRWDATVASDGPCDGTWDSLADYLIGRGWTRAEEPSEAQIIAQHRVSAKTYPDGSFYAWCSCGSWEYAGHGPSLTAVPAQHAQHVAAKLRAVSIEQETQPERTTCTRCEGDGAVYDKALADPHPFPFVCPVCKGDGDVPAEQETQP